MNDELRERLIQLIEENEDFVVDEDIENISNEDLANIILHRDSDDDRQNAFEIPLISFLIKTGKIDLANQLLQVENLDINAVDSNRTGHTPRDYAVSRGNRDLIERIIELGGNRGVGFIQDEYDLESLDIYTIVNNTLRDDDIENELLGNIEQQNEIE